MSQLPLDKYSSLIYLKNNYIPSMLYLNRNEAIINELLDILLKESYNFDIVEIPSGYTDKRNLLRGLLNAREAKPLDIEFLQKLDSLLQTELKEKGIVKVEQLKTVADLFPHNSFNQSDKFILWQGDITQLNAHAIVNAANKYMLGCFQPFHACIDNAIHSAAGPQLREDCETIMSLQRELESTGEAKITRGYNLPAKFVLHTVGPIVPKGTELTIEQKKQLASCYMSCLELANEIAEIKTVAFCAISTGVFGFPKLEAAHIAINTVNEWLNNHSNHFEKIIFNVFSYEDYQTYLTIFQP
ncbi:Appr-1-p processing protein [Priestia megaterium]|uniref:protein-ADP-ribose hydrolase n=1 Tax=Priestia megaterium TaxID=1404 RepID=UPI000BEE380E|nr:protein-ADP-ribose hydrolase [Priestia megaterium]PEA35536.1 Appr-1-p processing protein [Priestia megaterium]PGX42425.1 Appr-1-p processing protein [Priestia megaterium]